MVVGETRNTVLLYALWYEYCVLHVQIIIA